MNQTICFSLGTEQPCPSRNGEVLNVNPKRWNQSHIIKSSIPQHLLYSQPAVFEEAWKGRPGASRTPLYRNSQAYRNTSNIHQEIHNSKPKIARKNRGNQYKSLWRRSMTCATSYFKQRPVKADEAPPRHC